MRRLATKLSSRLRSSPCDVELVRWRCYEFEKGEFVLFTDEELKAIAAESRQTIDIVSFHPRTIGRSPLLRQALLPRARQARRQAIQPAAAGDDGHGALRVGQVGVAVKEIRGTGAALRGRPGAAAVGLRRRGATSQPSVLDPNHDSASSSVLAQPTMSTPASLLENR